jgi:hypothetical protein
VIDNTESNQVLSRRSRFFGIAQQLRDCRGSILQSRTLFIMNCPKCKDEGVIRVGYMDLLTERLCECKAGERLGELIDKIIARPDVLRYSPFILS